jgi:D-psicose/D-tagatose/L-ribulose 3-epimerase
MIHWMRDEPLEETVSRLARSGYRGIELNGEPDRYDAGEVKECLARHGIEAWGAVTLMEHEGRDMLSPDPYVRLGTEAYLRDTIDLIDAIGGQVLCCVPSTIGKTQPRADVGTEWGWCVDALRRVGDYAGERDVRIALEPITRFETYFLNRAEQALLLADDVGLDNVGVCLDAYHMNMEEADPLGAIRSARDRLFDFHVADSNRMPAGGGSLDWAEILAVLAEVGYEGYLTVEMEPARDYTPLRSVPLEGGQFEAGYYDQIVGQTVKHLQAAVPTGS